MEIQTVNKIHRLAKISVFICWLGLSFSLGVEFIDFPKVNILDAISYIVEQFNIFNNLRGGKSTDPIDFVMYIWET